MDSKRSRSSASTAKMVPIKVQLRQFKAKVKPYVDKFDAAVGKLKAPPLLREFLAEFLATFIFVLLANASLAQYYTTKRQTGSFFTSTWGYGLGTTVAILVASDGSQGHLNPIVTLALALGNRFPWKRIPIYWTAQYLGALVAAACVLNSYNEALYVTSNRWGIPSATNHASWPGEYITYAGSFGDQVLGSFLLLLSICAITDKQNEFVTPTMMPSYIGLTSLALGMAFGVNFTYAINPARVLAPRLITWLLWILGWGVNIFNYRKYSWMTIPIVAPHLGAVLGVFFYILILEFHRPLPGEKETKNDEPQDGSLEKVQDEDQEEDLEDQDEDQNEDYDEDQDEDQMDPENLDESDVSPDDYDDDESQMSYDPNGRR